MSGIPFAAAAALIVAAAVVSLAVGNEIGETHGRNKAAEEYRRAAPPPPCLDTATAIGVNAAAEDDAHRAVRIAAGQAPQFDWKTGEEIAQGEHEHGIACHKRITTRCQPRFRAENKPSGGALVSDDVVFGDCQDCGAQWAYGARVHADDCAYMRPTRVRQRPVSRTAPTEPPSAQSPDWNAAEGIFAGINRAYGTKPLARYSPATAGNTAEPTWPLDPRISGGVRTPGRTFDIARDGYPDQLTEPPPPYSAMPAKPEPAAIDRSISATDSGWKLRAESETYRASRLADECGSLRSENTALLAENSRLRRDVERLTRKAGGR